MLYSLSLVVILTSVLTGPSLVDADEITDLQLAILHSAMKRCYCAYWATDEQRKKFYGCYTKSMRAVDSKSCEEGSEDKYDKCAKFLDQEKIGDAKGVIAACKVNGGSDDDVQRKNEFSRCFFRVRNSLCKNSSLENEYKKSLRSIVKTYVSQNQNQSN